uniref:POP1 C-terminal domain-containing protein n=1 Tax=Glossina palpalis gambiensis TaxID=67801 RepID=A0A1B0BVQ7_9MUSC
MREAGQPCQLKDALQPIPVLLIRRPGSQRSNFVQLVCDWKSGTTNAYDFYVLRDRSKLTDIVECIKKPNPVKFPSSLKSECLIQLTLKVKRRGSPNNFSLICFPIRNDFKRNLKQIYLRSNDPVSTEPSLSDPNDKERKKFRLQHKKLLNRLRARRIREKRKKQETSHTKVYIRSAGTAAICAAQFKKICELWLPDTTLYTVQKQGFRDVFGYLTPVNFCLSEGTVGGTGYVTAEGLKSLLKLCQKCHLKEPMCFVRPNNNRHYRFATFKVNLHVW